jgi:DNA-binding GntR family transcriptional regulator
MAADDRPASPAQVRHAALALHILRIAAREAWPAGQRLTELHLARLLGVSRTPVRGALRRLASDGFARSHAERGFVLADAGRKRPPGRLEATETAEEALHARLVRDRVAGSLADEPIRNQLLRRYRAGRPLLDRVLARMQAEGLLVVSPGGGIRFAPTLASVEAQRASFELRLAVEPAGLLSLGFTPDSAVLEDLRHAHIEMRSRLAGGRTRPAEIFALDAAFHERLAEMSGNPFFLSAVRQQNRLRRLLEFGTYSDVGRIADWLTEHLMVTEALQRGDRQAAANALRVHLLAASEAAG